MRLVRDLHRDEAVGEVAAERDQPHRPVSQHGLQALVGGPDDWPVGSAAAVRDPVRAPHRVGAVRIVAGLLAVFYLYSGGKKVAQSREQLAPMMGWVDTVPMPAVRVIGVVEVLGAAGLVLPPLTGIAPALAVAAAAGFVLLQVPAIALHLSRGEANLIGLNVVLLVLAAVATWLATAF